MAVVSISISNIVAGDPGIGAQIALTPVSGPVTIGNVVIEAGFNSSPTVFTSGPLGLLSGTHTLQVVLPYARHMEYIPGSTLAVTLQVNLYNADNTALLDTSGGSYADSVSEVVGEFVVAPL
ncbi:MAG: hypothetical protein OHK0039_18650 [Bacteroidia bacterium]